MLKEIASKNLLALSIFLFLMITINGENERVNIPKPLKAFLGALEPYRYTQNDVVFLLDDSGSISASRYPDVKNFSKIIAQQLSVSRDFNRVAVLTFSTYTLKHVDYIQDSDGNMCTLGKQIDNIGYSAGGTHTDEGMEEAKILLARGTSPNKIVILLTDGASNDGHSPVQMAKSMRDKGIVIFAVGVADVNQKEIDDVATSKDHTYILSDFSDIQKINDYIVGDSRDDKADMEDGSLCDFNCDDNAKCYCGTRTGRYECMCNAGYFGSSGKRGQCSKCSKGTYKETSLNKDCDSCPKHSTTKIEGSTSSNQCNCEPGYQKNGNICSPVTCAFLTAPKGGFLIPDKCNNTFGSKCSFHCREGYCPYSCALYDVVHPSKTHSLLLPRTCLDTRKWTNDEFLCEKIKCAALNSPLNGRYTCSENDFSHGTTCKSSCEKGYELIGPFLSRTCEFGVWSGQDVTCKEKTCEQLKTNSILQVRPKTCTLKPRPFRSICTYFCTGGYGLVWKGQREEKSDGVLKCEADGFWSKKWTQFGCKDIEPPSIICPATIRVNTEPNKGFAHVKWNEPNATDNVNVKSSKLIEPKGYDKTFVFIIGKTKVVYEATDDSNHTNTCSFIVEVIDNEPPKVISCPPDIVIYNDSSNTIPVTWHGPIFEDNSGYVSYTSNRRSGDKFGWGPPSVVSFTASDLSNNTVSCSFTVAVKPYECPYYKPPANGVLTCDKWNYGKLCTIFCHDGFELAGGPHMTGPYICSNIGTKKDWKHFTPNIKVKMPWPDCSRKQVPISFNVSFGVSYDVDSCSDQILQKMKEKFFHIAKKLPPILCPKHRPNLCTPQNVQVTCNPIEIQRKRRSPQNDYVHQTSVSDYSSKIHRIVREAEKLKLTISFDVAVFPNDTDNFDSKQTNEPQSNYEVDNPINPILKTMEDKISLQVKDVYHLTSVPNPSVNYAILAICSIGQMKVNNSCIYCPPGTYKDYVSETCIDCPQATYQDEEGKLNCKPCPVGFTTYELKSKSRDDCKGPCQPGTHSETAFEPCFACPFNTYQDRSTRKECLKCQGLYTWKVGANSSSDCVAPCKPGTFSDTGYKPCTPCNVGSFQEKEMQKNCSVCPYGTSTAEKKAKHIKECKEIDICKDLRPCHPESTCIQHDKEYECICPDGLLGKNCEINLDDCANNPCFHNGTCVDLIGNFSCICLEGWSGHQCEINIDDCASNPCFNSGECIDKLNDYECKCIPGFSGERCERNIYECEPNPCLNNGTCFDMLNDYRCCCAKDYYGINCENKSETNVCERVTCENGGTCFSNGENFTCNCLPGFEGNYCELNIDNCVEFVCENGGVCLDGINNATCNCPSKFTGLHCETALTPEFLLSFPAPDTSNYAKMENKYRLPAITVAFYMKTSYKETTSRATPVSYSYKDQNDVVDNALTFFDTNKFVLYIHGNAIHTEYSANKDSDWHHYAVTWEKMHGNWTFYVDGNVIENGNIAEDKYMQPGIFILGQEQDDIGGQFSTLEAFAGDITEFNVWDYALNKNEIKRILSSCGYMGNIIPWYKVSKSVYGDVVVSSDVEKCRMLGSCPKNNCDCVYADETEEYSCKYDIEKCSDENTCFNGQLCVSNGLHSFCNCSKGFEGRYCEYDVDECIQGNGGCSHICVNDIGTYHCECPNDMFVSDDGKNCKDTSYCLKGDQIYMDGEIWTSSCQNCTCSRGIVMCEEIQCNEITCHEEENEIISPGECCRKCVAWSFCLISPSKTIVSFDMSSYKIEGECTYTAVEDCIDGHFKVQVESSPNTTNATNLVVYQDCSKIIISSDGSLLLDNNVIEVPYVNEEFTIENLNSTITIKTRSDLFIQWDLKNEAILGIPITNVNKMCGLCRKIEEYYIYGTGKFPLSERYTPVRTFFSDVFTFILSDN